MIVVHYGEYPCDHFKREIAKADSDIKHHAYVGEIARLAGSEHYILRLLQAIRCGVLRTDEIQLNVDGKVIDVDVKGEFIQPWPDDLFEADFYMRFSDYES